MISPEYLGEVGNMSIPMTTVPTGKGRDDGGRNCRDAATGCLELPEEAEDSSLGPCNSTTLLVL